MNTTRLSWLSLLLAWTLQSAAAAVVPAEVYPFDHDSAHAGDYVDRFDENTRIAVIRALRSAARDDALRAISAVKRTVIAGEDWFDLSGLVVHAGELPPALDLTRLRLDYGYFDAVDLSGSDLSRTLLRGARFVGVIAPESNLEHADLDCADFSGCDLRRANLRNVRFGRDLVFRDCQLDEAIFDNSHGEIRVAGGSAVRARFTNCSLKQSEFSQTNLDQATFEGADATDVEFYGSSLRNVNLSDATLTGARLDRARLGRGTRLIRATLERAYLGDVDLSDIDLRYLRWPTGTYYLGEELRGDETTSSDGSTNRSKADEYAKAEVAYRSLADRYRSLGYMTEYRGLRYRALDVRRKYLSLTDRLSLEWVWLNVYRHWDGYGTSLRLLTRNAASVVVFFAMLYFLGVALGCRWFVWHQEDEVPRGWDAFYSTEPHRWLRKSASTRRLKGALRLASESLLVSIDGLFMFADHLLRLRSILRMFRKRPSALEPVGTARPLMAAEAVLGLLLASSFAAQLVSSLLIN